MSSMSSFVKDFRVFLRSVDGEWEAESDVHEFRRWMGEDLVPFTKVSAHEQFHTKINYEVSIGNDNPSFYQIADYLNTWVELNEEKVPEYIWYRGTTEDRLEEIMSKGIIERSTPETSQHKGFEHDIGTVSLAKNKRDALFFSVIGRPGNRILLSIDIRKLDPGKIEYRELFDTPDGEILYSDDIPLDAVFLVERL